MNAKSNAELWQDELKKAVADSIAGLGRSTVGVGRECLWQLVASKLSRCPHAPRGTNAAYVAHEDFVALVSKPPYCKFVYA